MNGGGRDPRIQIPETPRVVGTKLIPKSFMKEQDPRCSQLGVGQILDNPVENINVLSEIHISCKVSVTVSKATSKYVSL
jgi:hypothetical protein